jgi:hypothetical protein
VVAPVEVHTPLLRHGLGTHEFDVCISQVGAVPLQVPLAWQARPALPLSV